MPDGFHLRYVIYKLCKLTRQSETYVKENYTLEEAVQWFSFESFDAYNLEQSMKNHGR